MEKIQKIRDALKLLEELGLPISDEQRRSVELAEREYITSEVFPLLIDEIKQLLEPVEQPVNFMVRYDGHEKVEMEIVEPQEIVDDELADESEATRQSKQYILRVTFPDGRVVCERFVKYTMAEVVKYAGCENVFNLRYPMLGSYLVAKEKNANPRYASAQIEVEPGYFLMTASNTDKKLEQIKYIAQKLGLDIKVEKVSTSLGRPSTRSSDIGTLFSQNNKRSLYSLNGSEYVNKRNFVLKLVQTVLSDNPGISFEELEETMPLSSNTNKTIVRYDEWNLKTEDAKSRYITEQMLTTEDGTDFFVSNQWTIDSFEQHIFPLLDKLGYVWDEQ